MKSEYTTVATFTSLLEADFAKARLESECIHTVIANGSLFGINGMYSKSIGGVKIKVENRNAEAAKEILSLINENTFELDYSMTDWGVCPNCGSKSIEVARDEPNSFLGWAISLLSLSSTVDYKFVCKTCAYSWKPE